MSDQQPNPSSQPSAPEPFIQVKLGARRIGMELVQGERVQLAAADMSYALGCVSLMKSLQFETAHRVVSRWMSQGGGSR